MVGVVPAMDEDPLRQALCNHSMKENRSAVSFVAVSCQHRWWCRSGTSVACVGPKMPSALAGTRVGSFLRESCGVFLNFSAVVVSRI